MYWFTVPVHHVVLEVLEVQRVLQVPTFSKGKKFPVKQHWSW